MFNQNYQNPSDPTNSEQEFLKDAREKVIKQLKADEEASHPHTPEQLSPSVIERLPESIKPVIQPVIQPIVEAMRPIVKEPKPLDVAKEEVSNATKPDQKKDGEGKSKAKKKCCRFAKIIATIVAIPVLIFLYYLANGLYNIYILKKPYLYQNRYYSQEEIKKVYPAMNIEGLQTR